MSCGSGKRNAAVEASRDPWIWTASLAAVLLVAQALRSLLVGSEGDPEATWQTVVVAAVALVAMGGMARRFVVERRRLARDSSCVQALDADQEARLICDRDGRELMRNARARALFGPAENPLAPVMERAGGDERAIEECARLRAAASRGSALQSEMQLKGALEGVREWLAVSVYPLPGGGVLWSAADVSARCAINETLRREQEMLADFIDFLPVGFYSADIEGRFRFVNQRLAEWVGRPPDELVGQALKDVLGAVPNPEEDRAEMRLKGRSGDIFQAFVAHSVFDEGGETFTRSVIVRDLMPERHWERALRSAERRFRWLFEDAPVGIVFADPDTSISQCNQAFAAMVGGDAEALAGRPVADFILPDDRPQVAEQFSRVLMGSASGGHLPVRLASGGRDMAATLYVGPTSEDGAISGLMLHFIDTTEQKNLELQFAQSQKMQAMGQLAGGVAHDFNNLLTAMIGFCDLLFARHGPGDASFSDIMQIKQNANRAASLIRQLLAFSRRQALRPRLFDVTDALADLSNLLRRLMGETIELVFTHGRDLGLVKVDPGQFDQVIINLAVNARDAMPGGGTLSIATRPVRVERPFQRGADVMPPGDYVMIQVADTGTGIAPENVGRIFEPFFSTKAVGAGTGLGLSTVYGILRQTDGFIFVESQPGHGATFSIYLPRFEAAEGLVRPRTPLLAESVVGDNDLTGTGTILLVEDEDAVRLFGARALRDKGYQVIEALSGENALDVLHADESIDVLVTDVVMPGMDGATLARLVRIERPHIQVVLMSGYSEDIALGEFSGEDGIHFLPKPFSLKQLAGKVKEVITNPK